MIRLEIRNCISILTEKQQKYQHYHQVKLINMIYSWRSEEILPSNQSRIIKQAKFKYSPLCKAFEKQTKTIEDQGIKQVEAVKTLKSEENEN